MKKVLILMICSLFFACTSPKNTAHDFLQALNNQEFETATELLTEESKPILYSLRLDQSEDMPKVEITINACAEGIENPNEMECLYTIKSDVEEFSKKLFLVKVGNDWKVDLMKME